MNESLAKTTAYIKLLDAKDPTLKGLAGGLGDWMPVQVNNACLLNGCPCLLNGCLCASSAAAGASTAD